MSVEVYNKESITYGATVVMETIICYKCAIPFAVPHDYRSHLRSSQESFFCPNGHSQAYTKSTESILREKIDRIQKEKEESERILKARLLDARDESASWQKNWETQLTEKKKIANKLKRTEKRIANGICPCCNRTFSDLQKHMKTKHPDIVKQTKS